jgi:hypothetical protein
MIIWHLISFLATTVGVVGMLCIILIEKVANLEIKEIYMRIFFDIALIGTLIFNVLWAIEH